MSSLVSFLKDSYVEFKDKVEWPKWMDLQSSTTVVAVSTLILALFTFGVDTLFSRSINNLFSLLINLFN
ncbi:preprotein translocase subunit SecE [Riemerella anatipestifer]|uniref:preprotein translocase subunit SecE n=1 Tax=Riemerella anatipestifer TaxID=34085 RepID=UPI0002ED6C5F|nr:preprotein translocase subunit SecE [Riemerella anatipestifer]AIH01976.1 preprotein translocase, sece subunit [Riemerella anatipestifer CH3]MCO7332598.1 preprotein translocase subunit SecE [Riemerella anatipestifer]MCO7351487.1 preprotein translocase subunit SecE [Riemerella anatipestifer]MCU7582004.1 preprotein translocase subunit SecE [Riemerella anatipestifer]MCW0486922.1 preprotein translocase subunit SecE [Riemerella anatipestifer]